MILTKEAEHAEESERCEVAQTWLKTAIVIAWSYSPIRSWLCGSQSTRPEAAKNSVRCKEEEVSILQKDKKQVRRASKCPSVGEPLASLCKVAASCLLTVRTASNMPLTIDASRPWRLSHVLEGHSSDVKSVYASVADEETELLHSASRDETARSWYRFKDDLNAFQRGASYQGHRYQNAVVHVAKREEKGSGESQGVLQRRVGVSAKC